MLVVLSTQNFNQCRMSRSFPEFEEEFAQSELYADLMYVLSICTGCVLLIFTNSLITQFLYLTTVL